MSAELALYERLATDSTMQRFVDEGFSEQRLQHVLDARFFSELSGNGLMGFDAQLAHFSDLAPTEREALHTTLNNWDQQWVPGSYWYEGCQTSLNAPSNTGWDYCSPEARAAAGALLLEVAPVLRAAAPIVSRSVPTGDFSRGVLDDGVLGSTDGFTGNITISESLAGEAFEQTLRHELVHQRIVRGPVSGPISRFLYNRSGTWTFAEEALAETIGMQSIPSGLAHPIVNGYLTPGMVVFDGVSFGVAGGAGYGTYEVLGR